jgi:hypothetical protein
MSRPTPPPSKSHVSAILTPRLLSCFDPSTSRPTSCLSHPHPSGTLTSRPSSLLGHSRVLTGPTSRLISRFGKPPIQYFTSMIIYDIHDCCLLFISYRLHRINKLGVKKRSPPQTPAKLVTGSRLQYPTKAQSAIIPRLIWLFFIKNRSGYIRQTCWSPTMWRWSRRS